MKLTDFLRDIGRPLVYYPSLSKITGGVKETIFLCNLIFWTGKQKDTEGWIRKSSKDIETETGLNREEQKTARKNIIKKKLLTERKRGTPPTKEFRVEITNINELWENMMVQNDTSIGEKSHNDGSEWNINWVNPANQLGKSGTSINTSLITSLKKQNEKNHHIVNNSETGKEKPLRAAFLDKEGEKKEKGTPTQEQIAQIATLCASLSDTDFNAKQFLSKYIAAKIPVEIIIYVLSEIVKQKQSIKNYWAYGITVLKSKYRNHNYEQQLQSHYALKKEIPDINEIFSKIKERNNV